MDQHFSYEGIIRPEIHCIACQVAIFLNLIDISLQISINFLGSVPNSGKGEDSVVLRGF